MLTSDPIFDAFLEHQIAVSRALADASDILAVDVMPTRQHVLATYNCRGLVKDFGGAVREANLFRVGFFLSAGHLRAVNPLDVVTLLEPLNLFHPNIAFGGPFMCLGHIPPGTSLVDLLYQTYEVISWQKLTPREDDALNKEACAWARANQSRIPVDRRPLKRTARVIEVEPL